MNGKNMLNMRSWKEFADCGLLWFINSILHLFGWAIFMKYDAGTDEVLSVFPARVKFRGFPEESNTRGYRQVSNYLKNNIDKLCKEANED